MGSPHLSQRTSGLLLHPTSLPAPHGRGDLGPAAHEFIDFLAQAGQRWWQMLPITPIGPGHSPYASPSSFAGNPLLLSLDRFVAQGLLTRRDFVANQERELLLRKAFSAWTPDRSFEDFRATHAAWLRDYALYAALKGKRAQTPWWTWEPTARDKAEHRLASEIRYHEFLQYQFREQWQALREHATRCGIGLIGDAPIYVAQDSADVWSHRNLFELDVHGHPTRIAGVPPDLFSADGQRWGNPLYRWDEMKRTGYAWWIDRLRATSERFDALRLDHFIGFERYWAIPQEAPTARAGSWQPGPGADFFDVVSRTLSLAGIIAEDLGCMTIEVHALRERFGFPGMRVLQFGFDPDPGASYHRPESYPSNTVAYTGTHDNDTIVGWFRNAPPHAQEFAKGLLKSDGSSFHWQAISAIAHSRANVVIVPVQDILGLDSSARMNTPGTSTGNWSWQLAPGALSTEVAERLRVVTQSSGRAWSRGLT